MRITLEFPDCGYIVQVEEYEVEDRGSIDYPCCESPMNIIESGW